LSGNVLANAFNTIMKTNVIRARIKENKTM
jgi:hypothetical protein